MGLSIARPLDRRKWVLTLDFTSDNEVLGVLHSYLPMLAYKTLSHHIPIKSI